MDTGLVGPVSVSAAVLLLITAPLMRGGNRHVAMIVLEAIALMFLLNLWIRLVMQKHTGSHNPSTSGHIVLMCVIVLSPFWLALVYLVPVPVEIWSMLAGRDIYSHLITETGIPASSWTLSLVADATIASLLGGLPLIAAFLAGYFCRLDQLKLLFTFVVVIALLQVLLGILQVSGGPKSTLYVGAIISDRPMGTFANPNHFANYIAMATVAYLWLGRDSLLQRNPETLAAYRPAGRTTIILWVAGGVFLVLGMFISRSRGALLTGLPAVLLGVCVVALMDGVFTLRFTLGLLVGIVAASVSFIGWDFILFRFDPEMMTNDAKVRGLLVSTTLNGAAAFWPLGAGWGSYFAVYPRFQSAMTSAYVDYAHHDFVQMLFEGGMFAVVLWMCSLWLMVKRAVCLIRSWLANRGSSPDEIASAICGIGFLGFLLHSLVEFNMHIPANSILGALFAGAYLRPLVLGIPDDRSS